jgi:LacI family transcriptional regulator
MSANLKQVAEMAGVSVMTVSRILRNCPNHNPETRAKVLRITEELNYKRNPLISALMSNLRHKKPINFRATIALVALASKSELSNPNQGNLRNGILSAANINGFEVEVFSVNNDRMTPERLIQILKARGFRCLIFEPFRKADFGVDFDLESFTAITITNSLVRPRLNRVEPDHFSGFLLAVEKLREKGYDRIGFIPDSMDEAINQNRRLSAFLLTESTIAKRNRVPLLWAISDPLEMKKMLNRWIAKYKPDVILTSIKEIPDFLNELGFRIPDDLGFVNLSLHEDSGLHAGVNSNWYEIGNLAACEVIESTISNKFGPVAQPKVTMGHPYWVDGQTLPHRNSPLKEIA